MTVESTKVTATERAISTLALTLAILAISMFSVILVLGAGGSPVLSRYLGPIAISSTGVSIVFGIVSVFLKRVRVIGVVSLVIATPCILLSALNLLAIATR
jgi:hypothetical protein